jgi:hypothetical protein
MNPRTRQARHRLIRVATILGRVIREPAMNANTHVWASEDKRRPTTCSGLATSLLMWRNSKQDSTQNFQAPPPNIATLERPSAPTSGGLALTNKMRSAPPLAFMVEQDQLAQRMAS